MKCYRSTGGCLLKLSEDWNLHAGIETQWFREEGWDGVLFHLTSPRGFCGFCDFRDAHSFADGLRGWKVTTCCMSAWDIASC